MSDLQSSIRTLIENEAPPLSIDDIFNREDMVRRSPRRAKIGVVAVGIAALLVVSALLVLEVGRTGKPVRPHHATILQSLPAGLIACMANPSAAQDGCPVTFTVAEQMLGISIPQPTTVPSGWVVIKEDVRQWPSNYSELKGVIPADFNQDWALPGTNLNSNQTPQFIQFNVQSAAQYPSGGLAQFRAGLPAVTLPNGVTAYGSLSSTYSALNWVANGNVYRLRTGAPMDIQEVESFIASLK